MEGFITTTAGVVIRRAIADDNAAMIRVDRAVWGPDNSPGPAATAVDGNFFERVPPGGHFVALVDDVVVGYVRMGHPTSLPASRHVVEIQGLGVHPDAAGRGVGTALVLAVLDDAREREAHKVSLRVMGTNPTAQRLYERLGFAVQGHLRDEFLINGRFVDDIMMCRFL